MNVRQLITRLLDFPMDAPVFIDLDDAAKVENAQEIMHIRTRTGLLGPVVILDSDWGKPNG